MTRQITEDFAFIIILVAEPSLLSQSLHTNKPRRMFNKLVKSISGSG